MHTLLVLILATVAPGFGKPVHVPRDDASALDQLADLAQAAYDTAIGQVTGTTERGSCSLANVRIRREW